MGVWKGAIRRSKLDSLEDIQLHGLVDARIPHEATLEVISYVDSSRVPLHIAIGPAWDVWTDNEQTRQWFESVFSIDASTGDGDDNETRRPWWSNLAQSDLGILVRVNCCEVETYNHPRITELLFYAAAVFSKTSSSNSLTTPPPSSSPAPAESPLTEAAEIREIRVFCLPLSSDLFYQSSHYSLAAVAPLASAKEYGNETFARFLPNPYFTEDSHPRKRQRVEELFDEVAERRRRSRANKRESITLEGGHSFTALLTPTLTPTTTPTSALVPASQSRQTTTIHAIKKEVEDGFHGEGAQSEDMKPPDSTRISSLTRPRSLSRKPTLRTMKSFDEICSKSTSRKDTLGNSRRPGLCRSKSMASFDESATISATNEQQSRHHHSHPIIEEQNRTTLSRVVMAGMRLYGYQHCKHPTTITGENLQAEPKDGNVSPTDAVYEEYKMMYYQTFKAAAFALRKQMNGSEAISPETMRAVVDSLLVIFCDEPVGTAANAHFRQSADEVQGQENTVEQVADAGDVANL